MAALFYHAADAIVLARSFFVNSTALVARGAWSSGINQRPTPLHALPSIVGDHSLCGSSGFVPYPDGEDDLFLAADVVVGDVPRKNLSD